MTRQRGSFLYDSPFSTLKSPVRALITPVNFSMPLGSKNDIIMETKGAILKDFWVPTFSRSIAFICLLLFLGQTSQARVFDFENESFSPFLNLRGGQTGMGTDPFGWQGVSSYGVNEAKFIYGGEFGARWRASSFGVSLGLLVQKLNPVKGAQAFDASNALLYTAETEALSFGPTLQMDIPFGKTPSHMWWLFLGGGYQFIKMQNSYQLTTLGQSGFSLPAEVSETYRASIPFATTGVGAEFLFVKTTTISLQLGYHHSLSSAWTHGQNGSNFAGNYTEGSQVTLQDGSEKSIHWSYFFLQVGFQFYVDTLR